MPSAQDTRRRAKLALITRTDVSRALSTQSTELGGALVRRDVTPGHDQLHHYWTRGKGLALWIDSPKPWTTLVAHLTKYVGPERAKVFASKWVHEVTGMWTGEDAYRVAHGGKARGKRIGPG